MTSERINPIQAWQAAISIKRHFAGHFDAFKYKFRMPNLRQAAFEVRRDRYFYEKASRKYPTHAEYCWFITANILAGVEWIGDMSEENLTKLQSRLESLKYIVHSDLKKIVQIFPRFDELLIDTEQNGNPPRILQLYAQGEITLETITIINMVTDDFLSHVMPSVDDPLELWNGHALRVIKYQPFVRSLGIDLKVYSNLILTTWLPDEKFCQTK